MLVSSAKLTSKKMIMCQCRCLRMNRKFQVGYDFQLCKDTCQDFSGDMERGLQEIESLFYAHHWLLFWYFAWACFVLKLKQDLRSYGLAMEVELQRRNSFLTAT
nr:hypothetical protein Iba_chr08bCG0240 [Ipomoea batatas]GME09206.1 hypothetical protein Iba_scaffold8367CG0020 [Ipomoea batatas]